MPSRSIPHTVACLATLVLIPWFPGSAQGQALSSGCDPVSFATWAGRDGQVYYASRLVLLCPDGTQIRADSAVIYDATARSELIGNVRIDHPERTLRAALADYYEREERLFARGAVEFRDLLRGSVLRGDTLTLLEAGALRVDQQVNVTGRPAFALMVPGEAEPGVPPGSPYEVTASRIRIQGERFFWASGDAEVVRDSLYASADSLAFDQATGNLLLTGESVVRRDAMEMDAQRISLVLPDDVLRSVELFGDARIRTDEMEALGDEVRLLIADDKVERLFAVRRADPNAAPDRPRPQLVMEELFVVADSVDVVSPAEVLESMTAVGRARVETRGRDPSPPDSTTAGIEDDADPRSDDPFRTLPVDDWMEGEVIVATFIPVVTPDAPPSDPDSAGDPSAAADTTAGSGDEGPAYHLERLLATGNAKSWYRAPPDEDDPAASDRRRWSISYLLADEISVHMRDGEVDWIEALGNVRGWQAEPEEEAQPAGDPTPIEDCQ